MFLTHDVGLYIKICFVTVSTALTEYTVDIASGQTELQQSIYMASDAGHIYIYFGCSTLRCMSLLKRK